MLNLTHGAPTGNNSAPTVAPDGGEDTVAVKKAWEEIERLASLPIVQYELARTKAAERLV